MEVELLSYDGSDASVVNTARVSFGHSGDWHSLPEGYKNDPDNLINYLAEHKHTTPFRHNSFTIRCKVPLFIARQLGKHQAGLSWNEVSRRYVDKDFEFHTVEEWRARPEKSIKQGSAGLVEDQCTCTDLYEEALCFSLNTYEELIKKGVAPEQARMILPQSMMVEYIWTGNLLAFSHLYKLRVDGHAQVEAQQFATALNDAIGGIMPVSWAALTSQ